MRRLLMMLCIAAFPAMVFCQVSKAARTNIKKMTVTKYVYDKGVEKAFPESEVWYDEKGNTIEEKEFNEGAFVKHIRNEYDAAGNKIKETELDITGKVVKTTTYKYDSSNRKTEKLVYDPKNKIKSKRTYQYESW
jgi:hypothetical protein